MPHPGEPAIGGGANAPPATEGLARSGPRAPDGVVAPEARAIPEPNELADSPEGRRIEQKLRAEALARRRSEDEDDAIEDPTGHA